MPARRRQAVKRPRRARNSPRESRREALVAAAFRAIARHGPAVSMDEIAAEAGITKPILYRHFGDRSGLVAAVTLRYLAEIRAELAKVEEGIPLRERTRAWLVVSLAYLERRPGLLEFIDRQRGFAASESREGEHVEGILELVRAVVAARGLDPRLAGPWAHGIGGLIIRSLIAWLRERERSPRRALPREAMADAITALLFDGLEKLVGR
jgi:AcrR family transcriptional regulator